MLTFTSNESQITFADSWQTLPLKAQYERQNPIMASLSQSQILISGGFGMHKNPQGKYIGYGMLMDGFVVDLDS